MSTMLRSLSYARKLKNVAGGRRLGSSTFLQRLRTARSLTCCLRLDARNYVTDATTAAAANQDMTRRERQTNWNFRSKDVNTLIEEIDRKIRITGRVRGVDVENVLKIIVESESMTSIQALLVIRCCGDFLSVESLETRRELAENVWMTAMELGVPVDVSHFNAKLLINLENETDFSPVELLQEMKNKNITPNRVTFQRLIEYYCNKGDVAGTSKILEHMSQQDIPINENIFNSLIKGHSQAGDITSAIKVLDLMKQAEIEPSAQTYSAILCAHAKRGDMESIRTLINECKEKDIFLSNKDILEVIYTLAVNEHSEHIDELITLLTKAGTYNKDTIQYIEKLIEKSCTEEAFKLLRTLIRNENSTENDGIFFLRKLIVNKMDIEKLIEYCKLMIDENINKSSFEEALLSVYLKNHHELALPLLKAMKKYNLEIREHYFYPILVSFSKANNLQGLLNTIKSMHYDFAITPSIPTLKEYVIPYMAGSAESQIETLNQSLPFSTCVNSVIFHLLDKGYTKLAENVLTKVNTRLHKGLLAHSLLRGFVKTKDVDSVLKILHRQNYLMGQQEVEKDDQGSDENNQYSAKQMSSKITTNCIKALTKFDAELIQKFLCGLSEIGININDSAIHEIEEYLKKCEIYSPKLQEVLSQLQSDELQISPIEKSNSSIKSYYKPSIIRLKEEAENSPEAKLQLVQYYARIQDNESLQQSLKELEQENVTYTVGFCAGMVGYFSKNLNTQEADKWIKRMFEIDPEAKLDKLKVLQYALAHVKLVQPTEVFKALDIPVQDLESEKNIICERILYAACTNFPEHVNELSDKLIEKGFVSNVTLGILSPVIKSYIDLGNVDKAIEKFMSAAENYRLTPQKSYLMINLIQKEDAKRLQQITDVCTELYGEMNALYDLSVAFFEASRPRQARKILETQGLRLNRERILATARKYLDNGDSARLEGFIKLVGNLFFDIDKLYLFLLEAHDKNGEWEKCVGVWTQMQDENIQPSNKFLLELERILKKHNQAVPFVRKIDHNTSKSHTLNNAFQKALTLGNLEEAENILQNHPDTIDATSKLQLIDAYTAEKNIDKSVSLLRINTDHNELSLTSYDEIVTKIVEISAKKNDFSTILEVAKIFEQKNRAVNQKKHALALGRIIFDVYKNLGKYDELLSHLEEQVNKSPEKIVYSIFPTLPLATGLLEYPETTEKVRNMIPKAIERKIIGPVNALWVYEFLRDSPKADEIWNDYIKNNSFHCISAIYVIKDQQAWNKLPQLTEKILEAHMHYDEKRRSFAALLKNLMDSDYPDKYKVAYECLKLVNSTIPANRFNQKIIFTIKQNLTDEQNVSLFGTEDFTESVTGTTTG